VPLEDISEGKDFSDLPIDQQLRESIIHGYRDSIVRTVEAALKQMDPIEVNEILADTLHEMGDRFSKNQIFLPQILLAASAMKRAFGRLRREFKAGEGETRALVLLATVKGDLHDIGKNIVKAILESNNFAVIDLGKDVSTETIVKAVKKNKPDIIGLSAMMTTTAPHAQEVVDALKSFNIHTPILVGGAVITPSYAKHINASYAKDAMEALKTISSFLK